MNQGKPNNTRTKIFDELMLFFENILVPYLDKRFGGVEGRLDGVENRLDGVENKLNGVEGRLDGVDDRLDGVEDRLETVETDVKIVKRGVEILQKTTPNKFDFTDHEKRITRLEKATFPTPN